MPSKITLLFNSAPAIDDYIALVPPGIDPNELKETFKSLRTSSFQSSIVIGDASTTAAMYSTSFIADYNNSNLFIVLIVSPGTISIEHPNTGYFVIGDVDNQTSGAISVSVIDTADPTQISITDVSFSAAVIPCTDVQLDITTDVLAVIYRINGGGDIANSANPFDFEQLRGAFINLEVENAEGNTTNQNIQVPQALSVSNTVINIINSPSGATVTAIVSDADGLELEYSLDDITFQDSNTFSGILEGSYTFYIKDQLSCQIEVPFVVPNFEDGGIGVQFPVADLPSKSNSIRYARRVTETACSNYANDENSLSCEQPYTQNPRMVNQLFQTCDIITTQIRSNYGSIVTTVIQEDGTETLVPVNQKTTNIGLKDKRDATQYELPDNQSGIFFTSGDTYDFDTDVQDGTYALNGGLPAWGVVGNFLTLDSVWYEIVNIIFDESKNAEVLVINNNYTGVDIAVIVGSIYNLQEYEVYEFTINMASYPDQKIQVNITETDTDPSFTEVVFLSELLDIKTRHANTVEIVYFSDINTDIFYSTGIVNTIRIPIEYVEGDFEDDTEAEKTDIDVYLVNAEIYESDIFHFQLLSKQLMRKVMQALAHKFVTIDEVGYRKESSPTKTTLIGTNLYRLSAPMIKAENVYTSQGTGVELEVGELDTVNLLEQTSSGYIKWSE
jgi:hypothetical protein